MTKSIDDRARTTWADATCIHQAQLEERSYQVAQTQLICAGAKCVPWLGPAGDESIFCSSTHCHLPCYALTKTTSIIHLGSPTNLQSSRDPLHATMWKDFSNTEASHLLLIRARIHSSSPLQPKSRLERRHQRFLLPIAKQQRRSGSTSITSLEPSMIKLNA